jgi:predicted metal-dependent hydrolase
MTQILVRRPSFELDRVAGGLWNPAQPELSHTLNAFQLALPYLEPYFIDAVKEGCERVADPQLKADVRAFCDQEANHARQHKRYCRSLQQRYPQLAQHEARMRQSLIESRRRDPLEYRLSYTAGYEAITAELARTLFEFQHAWFDGADPEFEALLTWHAAEELEHRSVAFAVLQAVAPSYALRAKGLSFAVLKTLADMRPVISYMLEVDGYAHKLDSRLRRLRLQALLAKQLTPALLRYLAPGHDPAREPEPAGYLRWQAQAPTP